MRDAHRIREQSAARAQSIGTVIITLAAVGGLAGVFGMGYTLGRRVQRMAPCNPSRATEPNLVQRLDDERRSHEALTFYQSLTERAREPLLQLPPLDDTPPPQPQVALPEVALPPPKLTAVAPSKTPKQQFTLQVSSVRSRAEAQAFAAAMTRQGLHPYITAANIPSRGTWYRVRVGRYTSEQEAKAAKATLAQSDIPAWVLRID